MSLRLPEPTASADAAEATASRRLWAAVVMTTDLEVCRSILLGRPVLARQLDAAALRRALRGQLLPPPGEYFRVRVGHLDGVAEAGPFHAKASR